MPGGSFDPAAMGAPLASMPAAAVQGCDFAGDDRAHPGDLAARGVVLHEEQVHGPALPRDLAPPGDDDAARVRADHDGGALAAAAAACRPSAAPSRDRPRSQRVPARPMRAIHDQHLGCRTRAERRSGRRGGGRNPCKSLVGAPGFEPGTCGDRQADALRRLRLGRLRRRAAARDYLVRRARCEACGQCAGQRRSRRRSFGTSAFGRGGRGDRARLRCHLRAPRSSARLARFRRGRGGRGLLMVALVGAVLKGEVTRRGRHPRPSHRRPRGGATSHRCTVRSSMTGRDPSVVAIPAQTERDCGPYWRADADRHEDAEDDRDAANETSAAEAETPGRRPGTRSEGHNSW